MSGGHDHDDLNEIYLQVCRRGRTNRGLDAVNDGERALSVQVERRPRRGAVQRIAAACLGRYGLVKTLELKSDYETPSPKRITIQFPTRSSGLSKAA